MDLINITILALTEIVGDFGLKAFANGGGWQHLSIGIIGYIGVIYWLIVALQGSTILLVNGAWDGISAILGSIAAYVILGERFADWTQYLGIVFIVIGLFCLKIPLKTTKSFVFPKFT